MKTLLVIIAVALAVPCLAFGQATPGKPGSAAQAVDPLVGTWELNLAKSTFKSGPPPRSDTRTFEMAGEGLKFAFERVNAEGRLVRFGWTANYDGKDYPCWGLPQIDTVSMRRIDRFTTESILKKAGKVVERSRRVVSRDGKVLTLTNEGTNPQGVAFKNVVVFDRR